MMLFNMSKQPVFLQQETLTDAARGQNASFPIFGQFRFIFTESLPTSATSTIVEGPTEVEFCLFGSRSELS
jgi:hypothetical protein